MLNQQKNLPDLTISHPILYVPNTQETHTLYKKQRSEDTPKTSTSSFKENEFQQIYFGKDAKTSIYKKRSMQNPRAAQKKKCLKKWASWIWQNVLVSNYWCRWTLTEIKVRISFFYWILKWGVTVQKGTCLQCSKQCHQTQAMPFFCVQAQIMAN